MEVFLTQAFYVRDPGNVQKQGKMHILELFISEERECSNEYRFENTRGIH